jgi:hypothetical protein
MQEPPPTTKPPFEFDLVNLTITGELASRLGELLDTARADLRPRNFIERSLVDQLALSQWRRFRVGVMQTAVFEHQAASYCPLEPLDADGDPLQPNEDFYHLAMAYAIDRHGQVLETLSRLEARYHREFCTSVRLLITLRSGSPPPLSAEPADPLNLSTNPLQSDKKERRTCEHCSNSSRNTQ